MAESQTQPVELPPAHEEGALQSREELRHPQRLCRFFSQGRYCPFGRRCRFSHQYQGHASSPKTLNPKSEIPDQGSIAEISATPDSSGGSPALAKNRPVPPQQPYRPRRLCRYFASGHCAMERDCRFWHPEKHPPPNSDRPANRKAGVKKPEARIPAARPSAVPEEMRAGDVTPEIAGQLRETEVSQLLKRFPKEKVIVQESEDAKVTYYRVTVEPTDPDWPFDLKEMDLLLEFPADYPLQVFTIQIPEDQDLPSVMGRHVGEASEAWLQAKHATNQLMGKVELLFRPFLRWLDRSMERLFVEGARLLKRDVDAERAGIEFVPYQQLQAAASATASETRHPAEPSAEETHLQELPARNSEDDSDSWISCEEEEAEPGTEADTGAGSRSMEGGGGPGPRKGTEIRFIGSRLGEGVGTLVARRITVSLQCSRCKVTADLTLARTQACTAQCEKCNSRISGTFLPSMMHQYSAVLGYVDIQGAVPVDLILQDCDFMIGCLNCSQEERVQSLSYGVTREMNCTQCHSKLSAFTEAARFQKVERKNTGNEGFLKQSRKKAVRDPSIQPGKPLPEHGSCRHYKKSCRWLRFPCCGKAYPCDVCHDSDQDHEMELASRMICGYCSKEQPYSNVKPCVTCGNMMNKAFHSSHWEGGKGCRNRVSMCRKDKQKYANSAKTVSRRSISVKK